MLYCFIVKNFHYLSRVGLNSMFSFDFRTRGRVSGVGSNRDQRDDVDRVDTRFTQSEFHHVLKKFT